MSLTATLANALSGLTVAQRALSLTAHNVANVNTEGYVRKVLTQEAVFVGSRGAGDQASEISRITDQFLAAEVHDPELSPTALAERHQVWAVRLPRPAGLPPRPQSRPASPRRLSLARLPAPLGCSLHCSAPCGARSTRDRPGLLAA
jgi:hypothetical protein